MNCASWPKMGHQLIISLHHCINHFLLMIDDDWPQTNGISLFQTGPDPRKTIWRVWQAGIQQPHLEIRLKAWFSLFSGFMKPVFLWRGYGTGAVLAGHAFGTLKELEAWYSTSIFAQGSNLGQWNNFILFLQGTFLLTYLWLKIPPKHILLLRF